jgi:hypothetical protein
MSKDRSIEDALINSFIEQDVPLWDPPGQSGEAMYNLLRPGKKQNYDLQAFEYFYKAQDEKARENPKYGSVEFQNFLKIYRPEEGFVDSFRDPENVSEGPALMWHEVYNRNTGLMKESALKGLKRMLASNISEEGAEEATLGG